MLYKFKSKAAGDLILLEPQGKQFLQLIGKQVQAKGIIEPEDMPAAVAALQAAIDAQEAEQQAAKAQAAVAKGKAEDSKVSIRNIRRDGNKDADKLQAEKLVTEDDCKACKEDIQELTKKFESKVNDSAEKKTAEIMEN